MATPRIFELNQKLLNNIINRVIVPRINRILTMFSVIGRPSASASTTTKKKPSSYDSQQKLEQDDTIYFRELDDNAIIKYLRENPIPLLKDDDKVISMLFNEKFYDNKRKRKLQWSMKIFDESQSCRTKYLSAIDEKVEI